MLSPNKTFIFINCLIKHETGIHEIAKLGLQAFLKIVRP